MEAYTIMRAGEAPDYTGEEPGAFRGYARPMGAEQVAVNLRVLEPGMSHAPPGVDPAWGHSHKSIEELYVVLDGELTVKLGEDVLTLGPRDAVLIQPHTTRSARNDGDADAAFLMISVKVQDAKAESVPHDDFWPENGDG